MVKRLAQLPKHWAVGFDAPLEPWLAIAGVALLAAGLGLGLRRGAVPVRLLVWLAVAAIGLPLLLAALGADYVLARNLLPAGLVLVLLVAVGVTAAGGAGRALLAGLVAIGLAVDIAVATDSGLQRDNWRAVADALGDAPPGGRMIVLSPAAAVPLRRYLRDGRPAPDGGATVREVAVVAVDARDAVGGRGKPRLQAPLAPFVPFLTRRGEGWVVAIARAAAPAPAAGVVMQLRD